MVVIYKTKFTYIFYVYLYNVHNILPINEIFRCADFMSTNSLSKTKTKANYQDQNSRCENTHLSSN